jgi:cbb3-type cytochrome c oxidase subunit II
VLRPSFQLSGWRGASLVAITYVYFLIFAQFAFLKRLANLGIADTHLKVVMGAMAAGGILLSLLGARLIFSSSPRRRLQTALCVCGIAALLTLLPLTASASLAVSFLIGAALGLLTVTLVTHLRLWLREGDLLLKVGLGTGLGYLICNFPPLFTASPGVQAVTAAALCLVGVFAAVKVTNEAFSETVPTVSPQISFSRVLICFTALVWLDSAAFFIIQNAPDLRAGTWDGTIHLWINGLLHLSAAVASAWLLRRRGVSFVLALAILALAVSCLLLLDPSRVLLASFFYPIGVSLYSVALVAYPSLLTAASSSTERARKAGLIYAVAGWFGSAMGIGMGQHLGQVPVLFVLLASSLVLGPQLIELLRLRGREVATTVAVLLAAFCVHRAILVSRPEQPALTQVERGRQVYISEGCINCHSQYVRPNTHDVLIWGPVQTTDELRQEHPPLIGNRRQGPDLSEVGSRRSPLWLKAHFYNPLEVSHASFMPSYAYLFKNPKNRGDDLVAYLGSLKSSQVQQHLRAEQSWKPSVTGVAQATQSNGAYLSNLYCATCHTPDGRTRQSWQASFKRLPPNLATGPWFHLSASDTAEEREIHFAQIVKFGIAGTDMPGHEYLSDRDVSSLALWLTQSIVMPEHLAALKPSLEKIDEYFYPPACSRTSAALRVFCVRPAPNLHD